MKSVNQNIIEKFNDLLGEEKVKVDEPMKRHTTFRIGGPADYFLLPSSEEELSGILKICKNEELPYFILGNGSNLLVSDEGYRGVIIQLYRNYGDITVKGNEIHATAGALLSQIAAAAKNASLTGFEFAGGIPGTLGGAVVMNAGAYGGEMKDVLKEVTVMTAAGEILVLPAEKLEMGYRTSLVKTKGYLVLSAVIVLEQGNQEAIKARMKELTEQRVSKQPLEFPSAGSTFKRPEGYFAGKLIMDAGLRGYQTGGAQVSEKHCGFVINKDNATAADVCRLLRDVQDKVKEQLGYSAEPSKGILAGSYVAYCLGLEPSNPMVTGKEIEPKDFQVTLPLGLTICYDNEVRNEVVNWMKEHGCEFTTYMSQPMLKLENTRVIIRRVLK